MFNKFILYISLIFYFVCPFLTTQENISEQGYIIYCPCMGRFGNQAEQFLGTLLFAKALNRTLVLPPFINYGINHTPELVPFESIIQVDPIKEYHNVILLTDFMRFNALDVWPEGKRQFYCFSPRSIGSNQCDALKGQPYKTFWTVFNISEDSSIFYKPLSTTYQQVDKWRSQFPPSNHRVLTFVGAPSPFPAHKESIKLQKYIKMSKVIEEKAFDFRKKNSFLDKPYLSMHIRHGSDWRRACSLLESNDGPAQLFSSQQCTGYEERSNQKLQHDICLPSYETISRKLNSSLDIYRENSNSEIYHVHIATDDRDSDIWKKLMDDFPDIDFIFSPRDYEMTSSMLDIYLMAFADVFIGNCVSSFSAFPARLRSQQSALGHMTFYFGFNLNRADVHYVSEEL